MASEKNVINNVPYGSRLHEWWSNLESGSPRNRTGNSLSRIAVVKDGSGCEHTRSEARRGNDIVILRRLIGGDQERIRLPEMDIERMVGILKRMRSFYFYEFELVALDPEVNWSGDPNIRYPEPVCPTRINRECVSIPTSTINNKSIREGKAMSTLQVTS